MSYRALAGNSFSLTDSIVETEIGDVKQPTFLPQVKLKRWDNDANFSIRFVPDDTKPATVRTQDATIVWERDDLTAQFYPEPDGYEFAIVLKSNPASNVLRFSLRTKSLRALYQGELTADEVKILDAVRPENVIGSYALYHASKKHGVYQTGKLGHIFRPEAVDASGKKTWCALALDGEQCSITVPRDFLDAAAYPVTVDPTLGYTTVGGTTGTLSHNFLDSQGFYAGVDGTATAMNVYVHANPLGSSIRMGIFEDNGSTPAGGALVAEADELVNPATGAFRSTPITANLVSTKDYWLTSCNNNPSNSMGFRFDTTGANRFYFVAQTYGAFPATHPGSGTFSNFEVSMYLDYTAAATFNPAWAAHSTTLIGSGIV